MGKGKVQHGQVVFGFFSPADEQVAVAVEPGVGTFNNPAPGTLPGLFSLNLLATRPNVRRVAMGGCHGPYFVLIVARVQAQVLLHIGLVPGLTDRGHGRRLARQRAIGQLHVVPIGPVEHDPDGNALPLNL